MNIASLYRYPVKSLTPEKLKAARVSPGRCIPWDRAFALDQGNSAFDPDQPGWVPKTNFMCLVRIAKIARLATRFDEATHLLTIADPNGARIEADPLTSEGQAALTRFLTEFLGEDATFGPDGRAPAFRHVPEHSFCDHRTQVISLIGLGSLGALEAAVGERRDERRFRANIYIAGIEPWAEFGWLGKTIRIGGEVTAIVQERIDRCGATGVNPDTAARDANPVKELQKNFGHVDLGIFAEILTPGLIRPGDEIAVL
jgi:uncharacterized protein YcbX